MRKFTLMFFMSLFSVCAFAQLPLEDFETWPPTGWGIYDNGSGTIDSWTQSEEGNIFYPPYAGTYAAFVDNENVPDTNPVPQDWLVTAQFTVPNNPQLRFFSRLTMAGNDGGLYRIMIGNQADQSDLASYTQVIEWTEIEINPTQDEYEEKVVDLPETLIGQQVYVAFVMVADDGDRWLVDNVSVVEQCLAPTGVEVENIGLTTADITWENPEGYTDWEIEIVEEANPFTGTGVTHDGLPPYNATLLTQSTDYKVRVRAVCGPGNNSEWSESVSFSTVAIGATCQAPIVMTLPFSVTDDTSNYGDDYDGAPGTPGCATTNDYLDGDDVVYAYTAATSGNISIGLTNIGTYAGVFVYDDCADIGVECIGGAVSGSTTDPLSIPSLAVTAGTTYYVVISTYASPQSTPYTLTVQTANCTAPSNLLVSDVTNIDANLSWDANGSTSWQIVVQPLGTGIPTGAGSTVAVNTNYNVTATTLGTSFTPATAYEYYVRADCGTGTTFSAWSGPKTFSTTQIPDVLDFTEGFEGATSWSLSNDSEANQWVIGNAINNGGSNSLYISNDNGVTNAYSNDTESVVHAYRDIQMPAAVDVLNLTYDWRADAESCCDYLRVWFVPAAFTPVAGTQITAAASGGIQVGGNQNQEVDFVTENAFIPVTAYSGQVMRLVFEWRNDLSAGIQPPAAVDNINLSIVTCPNPENLAASGITQTEAIVAWDGPTTGTPTFDYYLSTSNTAPNDTTAPTDNVEDETVTLAGLSPSTQYFVWVRSNCGSGDTSDWVGPVAINTLQIPASLDYTENFDGTINWTFNNEGEENIWVVGTVVNNGGTHALYITNDNGVNNAYSVDETSVVHAFRDLTLPVTAEELNVSFDWKADGESCCDYLRVWLVPTTFTPVAGTQITADDDRIQMGGNHNQSTVFTTEEYLINADGLGGQTMRLVFEWRNDGSGGTQPPAAVDNVNVSVVTCPAPANLSVSNISLTGADIAWEAPTTITPTYDYYVAASNTVPDDATTPTDNVDTLTETLGSLTPSTTYYVWVRSNCGNGDHSYWVGPLVFNTLCDAFDVPYYEGFNTDTTSQFCWTVLDSNGDDQTWDMDYTSNPYEGDQSANINTDFNDGANDDWLISPTINLTGNQRLKFHYRVQSSGEPNDVEVLLSTAGTDPASFTTVIIPLTTISNETYEESITNLPAITGPVNIAFHVPAGGLDGWRLYIDNVIIEDIPPCPEPLNVEISCISSQSANVTWSPGASETSWEVAVVPQGDPAPASGEVVNEPLYYAFDLDPETTYTAYVRSLCPEAENTLSEWISIDFTTPLSSVLDANAFCASDNPDASILFDNTYEDENGDPVDDYGDVACLGSTPNPVWYYLQVENGGQLDFQLIQNTEFDENGNPTGQGLDVDFVAYGPFTSLNEACGQIELVDCPDCPNNTTDPDFYPFGSIVDCSYSAAPIENFTIPGAVEGEIYAVLITNFNGAPGQIKLQQLPSSTGTTNCNILYSVDLGEDQFLCGVDETTITATVTTPGNSEEPTYEWFIDGVAFTPEVVETQGLSQTISVNEPGSHVYSVVITVENASNTEPITDEVTVVLGPAVDAVEPADYVVCDDEANDGIAEFDLNSLKAEALGSMDPALFDVAFFETADEAATGDNPVTNPGGYSNTVNPQTIYIRVFSIAVPDCYDVVPAQLVVNPIPVTTVDPQYQICEGDSVTITGTPVGYLPADAAYLWYKDGVLIGGEINNEIVVSEGGIYTLEVELNNCTYSVDTEVIISPIPVIVYEEGCEGVFYYIRITDVDGSFDPETSTISWTGPDNFTSSEAFITVEAEGDYIVTVTTPEGCVAEQVIPIESVSCMIPKGVSPNNDGLNDRFDLDGFNVTKLSIFNRYGQEVYSRSDYTDEWFGQTDSGDELPSGTYFYSMERANGESKTGWVYVNRQEN